MKKIIGAMLIGILTLAGNISSARTLASLGAETSNLRNDNAWLATQVKALEAQVNEVNAAVENAERELATARKARDKDAGGFNGWLEGDVAPSIQANYEAAQAKLAEARRNAAAVGKKQAELAESQDRVMRLLDTADAGVQVTHNAIVATIARQGLLGRFEVINNKVGAAGTALNMISKKYDETVFGAYVRHKISSLLNSQVICEAIKSCPAGAKVDKNKVEKELFQYSRKSESGSGAAGSR